MDEHTSLDAELRELGEILAGTPGSIPLQGAFGFLTGIATAPTVRPPSGWLADVFGENILSLEERAKRAYGLATRLCDTIQTELSHGREAVPRSPEDVASWCEGYLRAAQADPQWMADEVAVDMLLPFSVLAGQFDLAGEEDAEGNVITDPSDRIRAYREELPSFVLVLSTYWTERQRAKKER